MKLNRLISGALGSMLAATLGFAGVTVTTVALAIPAHAASSPDGTITRSEVLARAQNWVDRGVRYNLTRASNTLYTDVEGDNKYGPDCSGLVSMAWHITANAGKGGNSTTDFEGWSGKTYLASLHDLLPGDAILKSGHIELFAGWKNSSDHTQGAWTYSLNGGPDPDGDGWQDDWAKGPNANSHGQKGDESWSSMQNYRPIRYKNIVDDTVAPSSPPTDGTGIPADYNGDGFDDVAAFYDYGGGRTALFVWSAKAGGGFNWPSMLWDSGPGTWEHSRTKPVSGDFNGDGLTDIGAFYDYPGARTALFTWTAKTGGGFNAPTMVWDSGPGAWEQARLKAVSGDFNGDGYGDVGAFYDYSNGRTGLFIWSGKSGGGFNAPGMVWDSGTGTWEQPRTKMATGDFNRDGLTDIAAFYDYPGARTGLFTWTAKTSGGFNAPTMVWDSGPGAWEQARLKAVSGDFNGDGYGDVGAFYDYSNGRTGLFIWSGKSGGGFNAPGMVWDSGTGTWEQPRTKLATGDFNRDGLTDIAAFYDYPGARTGLFTWTAKTSGGFNTPGMVWDSGPGTWEHIRTKTI
ncbi:FG-GAP repeat domain-containing protein [Acrocarpospora catenulata]|uniref:FG-GAP repeat domain-containing protein n=1 Tax=Acrocarpospora catenulata TaxID=2836182 RepID=UPI001BDA8758|nr:VCBS repeat-containing protein [Acrocarpospora catenulata]